MSSDVIPVSPRPLPPFHRSRPAEEQPKHSLSAAPRFLAWQAARAEQSQQPEPCMVNAEHLVTYLYCCETLKLTEELQRLVHIFQSQVHTLDIAAFDQLFLPFLKAISACVEGKESWCSDADHYQGLYLSVLQTYLRRYVGFEPLAPVGWSRKPRGCGCEDCTSLDHFLLDRNNQTHKFAINQQRRDHLDRLLQGSYCQTWTEKSYSPYSLVVQKNDEEYRQEERKWRERTAIAKNKIDDIGVQTLEKLLGDRWRERLQNLEPTTGVSAGSKRSCDEREPLLDMQQAAPKRTATGAPKGPKTEIIDLCENL